MPTEQKMYYENPHREENYRYSKMHNPYYEAEMDQRARLKHILCCYKCIAYFYLFQFVF